MPSRHLRPLRSRGPAVLLCAALVACGEASSGGAETAPVVVPEAVGTPKTYALADPACTPARGAETLEPRALALWNGEESVEVERDLFGLTSRQGSLRGPAIAATYHGLRLVTESRCEELEGDEGALLCRVGSSSLEEPPRALPICRAAEAYPRDSVESIALSSAKSIVDAYRFYEGLGPDAAPLDPVDLHVVPRFEKVLSYTKDGAPKRLVTTDTDNALWGYVDLADGRGRRAGLFVLPRSREADSTRLFGGASLWEVPFVLAHELGHHVFFSHVRALRDDIETTEGHWSEGWTVFERRAERLSDGVREPRAKWRVAVMAVNEAVADLYAYYATGARLDGLLCLEVSRDVTSPTFADGTTKGLSASVVSATVEPLPSDAGCERPDLTEVHDIGAVLAHLGDALLTVQSGRGEGAGGAKAKLLLAALQRLDERGASLEGDARVPAGIYRAFVEALLARTELTAEECSLLEDKASGLHDALRADGYTCE